MLAKSLSINQACLSRGAFSLLRTNKLSTGAVSHAPPLKLFGTNGRYATALYTASSKAGLLANVDNELKALTETLKKSPGFASYLKNPTIPRNEKATKLTELLEDGKVSFVTKNLFLVLAYNGKLAEAEHIISLFTELIEASRGIVRVTVFSAEPLKKKHIDTLQSAVALLIGPQKTMEVSFVVKEELLGGLQVLVGDKLIDLSVSSRVAQLTKHLDSSEL